MKHDSTPLKKRRAFTLVELLVTVTIIGVLALIAIPVYTNVFGSSEESVAGDHVEALNRATANFSHSCWKLPTAPVAASTDDEYAVVRSLQYKFPATEMKPGSPFFDPRYDPVASSNSNDLRIRWNGKSFELLKKGQSGTGLRVYNGHDYKATPYAFPAGYKPEGAS